MRTTPWRSILAAGFVLAVMLLPTRRGDAQPPGGFGGPPGGFGGSPGGFGGPPGGFGAQMWMDRFDQNDNGRLDPDELSENRFLTSMAERAGVDSSRGLSSEDVERIFENLREQGGFGGFGRDRGERGSRGGSDRDGRNGDRRSASKAPEPPPRVTIDLQAAYSPGDSNADGQLELSEWLRWKGRAALAEFLSLDRNSDGILTPRELAQAQSPLPVDLARLLPGADPAAFKAGGSPPSSANPTMTGGMATNNPLSPVSTSAGPTLSGNPAPADGASVATADQSSSPAEAVGGPSAADTARHTATAERFFQILDRDRDGKLTDLEWQRSARLRPKFEQVGADLSQPMTREQFVSYYVKVSTSS